MNIQKINNVAFNGGGRIVVKGAEDGGKARDKIIYSHEITAIVPSEDYTKSTIYWKPPLGKEKNIEVDNTAYSSSCPAYGHNAIINAYTAANSCRGDVDIYV